MSDTATTPAEQAGATTPRGGYRGTAAQARFTEQLVGLVTPETRDRVLALTAEHRISQSKVLRAIIGEGLARVERGFADGSITSDTLA